MRTGGGRSTLSSSDFLTFFQKTGHVAGGFDLVQAPKAGAWGPAGIRRRIGPLRSAGVLARAYDRLAVELFGVFAYVNSPEDWPPARREEVYARKEMVQAIRNRRAERQTGCGGSRDDS